MASGRPPRQPRPRAKRGEGERLRDEILAAASELLLKTGSEDAVSIRAVADAVGVTPPSIYLHFADKESLLLAVCELQFQRFDEFVEAAVGTGSGDPLAQLLRRGAAYVRFGIEHPEHYRILFMSRPGSVSAAGRVQAVSGFDRLVENVEACIASGAMSGDQDPLVAATGLWVMVHGVTSLAISVPGFPEVGVERLMTHLSEVYTKGLS